MKGGMGWTDLQVGLTLDAVEEVVLFLGNLVGVACWVVHVAGLSMWLLGAAVDAVFACFLLGWHDVRCSCSVLLDDL